MATWDFLSHSTEETIQKGRELAAALKPPVLVMLFGELGSGKTTLTKGMVRGLGAAPEEDVTSPTFTLVHAFHNPCPERRPGTCTVYHVDLYRVADFHDLETLGLEDVFAEPAIVIVEWSEKLTLRTDWPVVEVRLEHVGEHSRRIEIHDPNGNLASMYAGP